MSDSSDSGWSDDEGDEAAPSEAVETVATSAAQPQYQAQAFFFNKTSQTYEPRGPCAVQARNPTAARCNCAVRIGTRYDTVWLQVLTDQRCAIRPDWVWVQRNGSNVINVVRPRNWVLYCLASRT